MKNQVPSVQSGRKSVRSDLYSSARLAMDEYELAGRWGLSVKTLRRWRQEQLGPVFCKLGARVTYLILQLLGDVGAPCYLPLELAQQLDQFVAMQ